MVWGCLWPGSPIPSLHPHRRNQLCATKLGHAFVFSNKVQPIDLKMNHLAGCFLCLKDGTGFLKAVSRGK